MRSSHEISSLASRAVRGAGQQQGHLTPRPEASQRIRKLFVVLQGAYGTAFLAKFSSGELNERREDKGVRAAQLVWDADLAKFEDDVIEAAFQSIKRECPEFPPSLPQFEKLCEALTPRKNYFEEHGLPMLPPPKLERVEVHIKPVGDGKDQFRKIWARHLAGDKTLTQFSLKSAIEVLGAEAATMKQQHREAA